MAKNHPHTPSPAHLSLLILFIVIPPSSSMDMAMGLSNSTKLVKEVCNRTSDYAFCVETLSKDPNAGSPNALAGDLASAALRFAQTASIDAQSLMALLLKNATAPSDRDRLQSCQSSYNQAISELSSANNDFNSDALDTVVEEMNTAAAAIKDCQNGIQGGATHFSSLAAINAHLIKLGEICTVSITYFTLEDFY